MEEEEREAQSAKLQELIRRGQPDDLQEANRLMKIMAGYDTRSKVDYRAKAAEDVSKIQAKAKLLEERLAEFKPGDDMTGHDVFAELASSLQNAQPKIQKMCEEESDDHEAVAKLFEINDSIHRTVERYKLMKKGDWEGASKIAKGEHVASSAAVKSAAQELNLIDFDGDAGANGSGTGNAGPSGGNQAQAGGLEDDLLGLSIGESEASFGQTGGISLGFGSNTSEWHNWRFVLQFRLTQLSDIPGPALLSSVTEDSSAKGVQSPTQPFSAFSAFSSGPSTSKNNTPQPPNYSSSAFHPPAAPASDPFAGLGSPIFPQAASASVPQANDDDEWSFASALPTEAAAAVPREQKVVVSNTSLKIDLLANRTTSSSKSINLLFAFSNNTAQPISELHFQLAVTKVCPLVSTLSYRWEFLLTFCQGYESSLKPQTGRSLEAKQSRGITQAIEVWHAAGNKDKKVDSVKLRWRVAYKVNGEAKSEMGEIPEFSIA